MLDRTQIKVVHKEEDDGNLIFFMSLNKTDRLKHLEDLRTQYFSLRTINDSEQRFQRFYRVVRIQRG